MIAEQILKHASCLLAVLLAGTLAVGCKDSSSSHGGGSTGELKVQVTDAPFPNGVIVKAEITSPDGRIVAMGHAEEVRAASKINQTSAVENCESSAIGRALAAAGFGGSEYASADEVQRAIAQQEQRAEEARRWSDKQRAAFCAKLGDLGLHYDDVARWCELRGRPRPSVMPADQRRKLLQYLSRGDRSAEIHAVLEGK